jgi:hypothetical protein
MIDYDWLRSWIQPQHLEEENIRAYREAFTSQPEQMLVLRNFLVDEVAEQLSHFLTAEAQFSPMYGLYTVEESYVQQRDWEEAPEHDRFFRYHCFTGISAEARLTPGLINYLKFRTAFLNTKFREFFEAASGVPLNSKEPIFNTVCMKRGDYLRPHSDRDEKYQLAYIFYLSPYWEPSMGGAFHMVERGGRVTKIDVEFNNLIFFDVTQKTKHWVAPIKAAAEEKIRATFSGWIYKPDASL